MSVVHVLLPAGQYPPSNDGTKAPVASLAMKLDFVGQLDEPGADMDDE